MKVILVDQRHGHTRTIVLKGWLKGLLSICILGAPVAFGYLGYQVAVSQDSREYSLESALGWTDEIESQADAIAKLKQESSENLEALTLRLATLQARLLRLEALGERITTVAQLDSGEFNFTQAPPVGGPLSEDSVAYAPPEFLHAISELEQQIADRAQQLEILEGLMAERQFESDIFLAGRPVKQGWISSPFGRRTDPFTGRIASHYGIDFATSEAGADIVSVAAGVVTSAGERQGYGLAIDVNHGNGYVTRYGHAEALLVDVGEVIKKGQTIGLVGSTGRSTGPHVHFEVYKNGRVVDPASYIHRTAR
ncbi:MAG: M23 family metallopeptidase [Gammaproteobacteria bacterium]|nr:M23 family metallopeptidase [Gammaproteobacteria bacterium]MDP2140172.1 M23 family metallopeptidase [Gammaproteobacteria bacterium]MDP2348048.1 M23 family metallopeptidase [Gammaproteobacteria bacterium]